jgi:hypothetical protein
MVLSVNQGPFLGNHNQQPVSFTLSLLVDAPMLVSVVG